MATLRLGLFGTPRDELASTVDGDVPEWIHRLYASYGTSADRAPASASVKALAEHLNHRLKKLALLLSKMELLGWHIESRKWELVARTELDEVAAQAELEAAGVWIIAREHAPVDEKGNVHWSRGIFA